MRMYKCHICHGLCDPGELENGVCFDCRAEQSKRDVLKSTDNIKLWNQKMQQRRYAERSDGQLVLNFGS